LITYNSYCGKTSPSVEANLTDIYLVWHETKIFPQKEFQICNQALHLERLKVKQSHYTPAWSRLIWRKP